MDAAVIQQRLDRAYAKSAAYLGQPFQQFRPAAAAQPTTGPGMGALNAVFTMRSAGYEFAAAPAYKDVLFLALVDGASVQVGDYLVGTSDTYFIAQTQPLLPILAVRCNRVVSVVRPGPSQSFGANTAYGGTTPATETPLIAGWPASLLFDARGKASEVGLPTDLPSPYFDVLLPAWGAVDLRASDFIEDDLGRRYLIAGSEKGPLGWRLFAQQAVT